MQESKTTQKWNPDERQFSMFQEYHSATKELIFLCEDGDFALQNHLGRLTELIIRRQQLLENIEGLKNKFPKASHINTDKEQQRTLLLELSGLEKKAQQLLENKIKILKGKMSINRQAIQIHKTYHPPRKQYEGFFIDCKTIKK